MKLGLLTFHTAANYGAALQAYAFEKFLKETEEMTRTPEGFSKVQKEFNRKRFSK